MRIWTGQEKSCTILRSWKHYGKKACRRATRGREGQYGRDSVSREVVRDVVLWTWPLSFVSHKVAAESVPTVQGKSSVPSQGNRVLARRVYSALKQYTNRAECCISCGHADFPTQHILKSPCLNKRSPHYNLQQHVLVSWTWLTIVYVPSSFTGKTKCEAIPITGRGGL
jgi:hypothetical protein